MGLESLRLEGGVQRAGAVGVFAVRRVRGSVLVFGLFRPRGGGYRAFGRTAQASVIRANSPDGADDAFLIRYGFTDAKTGGHREEVDAVPSRWGPPPDVMAVEYIPGRTGESRVAGNRSWVALGFFALTSLGLLVGLAYLYRDARRAFEPYHPHHHGLDSHDSHRHAHDLAGYSSQGHDSRLHQRASRASASSCSAPSSDRPSRASATSGALVPQFVMCHGFE